MSAALLQTSSISHIYQETFFITVSSTIGEMASPRYLLLLLGLVTFSSCVQAFNVTQMLEKHSDFETFSNLLTKTKLADEINKRQTITVLAVDNSAAGALSGKTDDLLQRILSVHVILDYYDLDKLKNLQNKSSLVTTLFQSSGQATERQGFLNVTRVKSDEIDVGSAVAGSPVDVKIVKAVDAKPYNISILQVSGVILPTGIDVSKANTAASPPPKSPASSPVNAPAPDTASTPSKSKTKNEASSPSPKASTPSPSDDDDSSVAETPADALSPDEDDLPVEAPTPGAFGPSSDGPAALDLADGASSPGPSADDEASDSSRLATGLVTAIAFASLAAAF